LIGVGRPGAFQAAGDGVAAKAAAEGVLPAQALLLDAGASGSGPTWLAGSAAPWALPKVWPPAISATVSSSFIAMRAKVSRMSRAEATGSGIAVRAFRVDVDQAHLHGGQRVVQLAVAG
jgi:hypothetical protein